MNFKLIFLILSYVGQGLSYGRFYLAHAFFPFQLIALLQSVRGLIRNLYKPEFTHALVIFLLYATFSLAWTDQMHAGQKCIFYLGYGISQILLLGSLNPDQTHFLAKSFLFISGIEVILSVGEAWTIWRYPISELSSLAYLFKKEISPTLIGLPNDSLEYILSSPTGFRWSPNNLGFTLVIVSTFMVRFVSIPYSLLGIVITSYLNVMTGSRMLFYGFFLIMLIQWTSMKRWRWLPVLSSALLIPLIFVHISGFHAHWKAHEILQFPVRIVNHFTETDASAPKSQQASPEVSGAKHTSEVARSNLMKAGWSSFLKAPLLGHGAGSGLYTVSKTDPWSLHNFGLELLVEYGMIGMFFILSALWLLYRDSPDRPFTCVMFLVLALGSVAVSSLYYFPAFYLTLGLLGKTPLFVRPDKSV